MYLSRRCGERVAHINNTNTQYNLPAFKKKLSRKYNHDGVAERVDDPAVRKSIEVDLDVIDALNQTLKKLEWYIEKTARQHYYHTLCLLRSIPVVGRILALVILYEIHDIRRFPRVQDFFSYARLIRPVKESDANGPATATRRSATIISSGPSRKRRFSCSGTAPKPSISSPN
jgi:transposase